ncbi:MAG TPA: hypothetical protein VIY73_26680, partial [Polyangiaceae bacterium]
GGAPTVVATNQDYPWAIAVDDNNVYWTNYDNASAPENGGATSSGAVMKVPLTGGTPVTLDQGLAGPWGIAIDATNVYYTNAGGGHVKSVPIAGGTVTTLASNQQTPVGIAVDGTNVYWANYANGTIGATAKGGGGGVGVLTTSNTAAYVEAVAVNATTLFFGSNDGNTTSVVASMPLAGSSSPTILASGRDTVNAIALDSTNVYWVEDDVNPQGNISTLPLGGGTVTKLAPGVDYPTAIAVDATGLYYVASGAGRVWRLTPP